MNSQKAKFYFKQSDLDLLRSLADFHFLEPDHFQKLSSRNIISIRRRLRQMFERGYLERLKVPLEHEKGIYRLTSVYYLAPRGLDLARQYGLADQDHRHNSEKKIRLIEHDLQISNFHLCLQLACQNGNLELISWEQRRAVLQDSVQSKNERLSVNPDALFALTNKDKPAEQNTNYFFLEMVLARESKYENKESYFVRKMRAYFEYAKQNRHRERWGIPNFRVITIVPTYQRAVNLCSKLREVELNFKRFWFTDFSRYSLQRPEGILERIFITPKDHDESALYSFAL